MPKLRVHRKGYHRKGYTRIDGTRVAPTDVPPSNFKVKDRGKKGRTPKSERWYNPKVHTGWEETQPQAERVARLIDAHGGDLLAAGRSARALANVTTDAETRRKAASDAKLLFDRHNRLR